ncbi:hypothetical protein NX059_008131 [Plenodomus lindquistii]|nr:hypothetical protein NX059_008131 [Plenodomus lindquistii]
MASIPRRLLLQSRQCPARIRTPRYIAQWQRPLSSTTPRSADDDAKTSPVTPKPAKPSAPPKKTPLSREQAEANREAAMLSGLQSDLNDLDPSVAADALRKGKRGIPFAQDYNLEIDEDFDIEEDDKRKVLQGFWAEGDESMGVDEDYFGDDVTSHGHGELQIQRDIREYARLIAWELPLLSHLARPFTPPTETTPFRFRYTSYLGESHPATNKVVVEFSPPDLSLHPSPTLSLTPPQIAKLIKLAGPRYNPTTQVIKLSCEAYDTQAQNKRFLGETINSLIKEAKDEKDMFDDVPFDFRHAKVKKRTEFPEAWVMTQERKKYLEGKRREGDRREDRRRGNGEVVDGRRIVETSLPFLEAKAVQEPVMVGAGAGAKKR